MALEDIKANLRNHRIQNMSTQSAKMEQLTTTLLNDGLRDVLEKKIKINDVADLQRVWTILKESSNYNEILEENGAQAGMLPELKSKEALALGVQSDINEETGKEEYADTINLNSSSEEDIEKMATDLFNTINNDNVDTFDKTTSE